MEWFASQEPHSYSLYFDLIFDFGPEKLPRLSTNGPLGYDFLGKQWWSKS